MEGLRLFAYRWGKKYGDHYVDRLRAGIARNLKRDYEFRVLSPEPEDEYLTKIPGCLCRLRLFDPKWQAANGIKEGDRIVSVDLDMVITGPLDDLFAIPDPFAILLNANLSNPCRYNGSVFSLVAGYRPDVWSDFSLKAVSRVPYAEFPDDQAWFAHELPGATSWEVGSESGVFAFQKGRWPKGDDLPEGAKIVAFPGWRDPSRFTHLDWVKEHWAA